jgi:MFS family permease
MAITILFAVQVLDLGAGAVGLIFAFGTAGGLLGAVVAGRVAKNLGVGPTIVGSAATFGIPGVMIPLATPSTAWIVLIGAFSLFGFGGVIYNINQVSLRQAITPDRMQGRMNASMRFMVWGTMPIGSFVGGVLGNTIGLRPTLWVAAVGGLFSFVPPLLSPVRSLERIQEPAGEGTAEPSAEAIFAIASDEDGVVERGQVPRP